MHQLNSIGIYKQHIALLILLMGTDSGAGQGVVDNLTVVTEMEMAQNYSSTVKLMTFVELMQDRTDFIRDFPGALYQARGNTWDIITPKQSLERYAGELIERLDGSGVGVSAVLSLGGFVRTGIGLSYLPGKQLDDYKSIDVSQATAKYIKALDSSSPLVASLIRRATIKWLGFDPTSDLQMHPNAVIFRKLQDDLIADGADQDYARKVSILSNKLVELGILRPDDSQLLSPDELREKILRRDNRQRILKEYAALVASMQAGATVLQLTGNAEMAVSVQSMATFAQSMLSIEQNAITYGSVWATAQTINAIGAFILVQQGMLEKADSEMLGALEEILKHLVSLRRYVYLTYKDLRLALAEIYEMTATEFQDVKQMLYRANQELTKIRAEARQRHAVQMLALKEIRDMLDRQELKECREEGLAAQQLRLCLEMLATRAVRLSTLDVDDSLASGELISTYSTSPIPYAKGLGRIARFADRRLPVIVVEADNSGDTSSTKKNSDNEKGQEPDQERIGRYRAELPKELVNPEEWVAYSLDWVAFVRQNFNSLSSVDIEETQRLIMDAGRDLETFYVSLLSRPLEGQQQLDTKFLVAWWTDLGERYLAMIKPHGALPGGFNPANGFDQRMSSYTPVGTDQLQLCDDASISSDLSINWNDRNSWSIKPNTYGYGDKDLVSYYNQSERRNRAGRERSIRSRFSEMLENSQISLPEAVWKKHLPNWSLVAEKVISAGQLKFCIANFSENSASAYLDKGNPGVGGISASKFSLEIRTTFDWEDAGAESDKEKSVVVSRQVLRHDLKAILPGYGTLHRGGKPLQMLWKGVNESGGKSKYKYTLQELGTPYSNVRDGWSHAVEAMPLADIEKAKDQVRPLFEKYVRHLTARQRSNLDIENLKNNVEYLRATLVLGVGNNIGLLGFSELLFFSDELNVESYIASILGDPVIAPGALKRFLDKGPEVIASDAVMLSALRTWATSPDWLQAVQAEVRALERDLAAADQARPFDRIVRWTKTLFED